MDIWAKRSIEDMRNEAAAGQAGLQRTLGTFSLTCFGVGSTIGAGVFVLTGTVAAEHTGPAVAIAYLLASLVCLLAGLCYAELASMIPVAGSAYSYAYATLGEGVAWIVGWCLVLEYLLSGSIVAIGWSGYARAAGEEVGLRLPSMLIRPPLELNSAHQLVRTGALVDLPAFALVVLCTQLLLRGVRVSAAVNSAFVSIKVVVLVFVVCVGFGSVHSANWSPFIPPNRGEFGTFGWSGVLRGAAILFFAYTGFDAVSTLGQESRDPQRTIPRSLLVSLAICALIYLAVGLLVTGLVSYRSLNVPDPIYFAFSRAGSDLRWAKVAVSILTVFGLISVTIVNLLGQVRIFYAMGRDRLLPPAFASVDRTGTPRIGTIITGVVAAIAAGTLPLSLLGELVSIGTLLAFAVVCGGVLVLRVTRPEEPRPFRVPFAPWTPVLGVLACVGLMFALPALTWARLAIWLGVGALVYFLYGARRSPVQIAARARRAAVVNVPEAE